MEHFLSTFVILLLFIVLLGFFNEKVTKFTYEISLMLFSVIIGAILLFVAFQLNDYSSVRQLFENIEFVNIESFLMKGFLCFMLFAGSCHMKLLDFKKHARVISVLAFITTLLGAVFYGTLFWLAGQLIGLSLSYPVCLMFGSITAPTDPIAATSILKKFNLPKNISFIMEGESLLNDGVGVALFVCFSGMVSAQNGAGFFAVMAKELLGALLVGVVVSFVCFFLFKHTNDVSRQIFISLLAVSSAYLLCEHFGFSGAIASVVCGLLFSAGRNYEAHKGNALFLLEYDTFWEMLDKFLNSALYVLLGLSFVRILQMEHVLLLSVIAIVANLIGRAGSLGVSSFFCGPLPDNYDKASFIKLLTWGGLRGGLSIALAMSTQSMVDADTYFILLGGTYAIVFFTTIVQGMTMKKIYSGIEAKVNARSVK